MNTNTEGPVANGPGNNMTAWRHAIQPILPARLTAKSSAGYDIYPVHPLGNGKIHSGYDTLANWIATQKIVLIDGYAGIFWDTLQDALNQALQQQGVQACWHRMQPLQKAPADIAQLVAPFIGRPGDVWGKKCTLHITDFFKADQLRSLAFEPADKIHIVIGTGAALTHDQAPVIYLDIPKNELQYRMRAGSVTNFGSAAAEEPEEMYKRAYFVDWVVLNDYKRSLSDRIAIIVDAQRPDTPAWIFHTHLREGMDRLSRSSFRVRPWFEPGAWGGQWMKAHIGLNKDAVNYAWSFEMIVPENGILFESSGYLLEVPFEWMMFYRYNAILGRHAAIFRYEFPIRFDFLDTFDGGNLSIQCHPFVDYIREHFGETFTQDETYYILDCKEGAAVYLGFQEGINATAFRKELEDSRDLNKPVDIEQYVQRHRAKKHDLFLIPNGTVHSAGADNLVLEISATPYIFTFKMYDWLRLGLDGKPRAINIAHAFHNLDFRRQGDAVTTELMSAPQVIAQGPDWQLIHLPTHAAHFYDVHRVEFDQEVTIDTNNCCLVMMLVEGTEISVTVADEATIVYHYAETFVIPAAAGVCRIKNNSGKRAKLIKAFLKREHYIFSTITSNDHAATIQ